MASSTLVHWRIIRLRRQLVDGSFEQYQDVARLSSSTQTYGFRSSSLSSGQHELQIADELGDYSVVYPLTVQGKA